MNEQLHPSKSCFKPPFGGWGQLYSWCRQHRLHWGRRWGRAGARLSLWKCQYRKTLTLPSELWLRIFFLASKCFTGSSINLSEKPSRQEQQKTNSSHPNSLNNSMPATPPHLRTWSWFFIYFPGSVARSYGSWSAEDGCICRPRWGKPSSLKPGYPTLLSGGNEGMEGWEEKGTQTSESFWIGRRKSMH